MKKRKTQLGYYVLLFSVLAATIFLAISIQKFVGFAGVEIAAQAGNVTALSIYDSRGTIRWHGLFGLAFVEPGFAEEQSAEATPGDISSAVFVFECIDPNNLNQEIYASTSNNVSFDNVTAGTFDMIDSLFTEYNSSDNAANTFTDRVNISLGSQLIEVPASFSYVNSNPDGARTFFTGILNASGELLLVMKFYQSSLSSFKGSSTRFQILLPVANASTTYFFYSDPNDNCPSGISIGQIGDALVAGFVFDSITGDPIFNASVSAGGNQTLTDGNGFFNLTVPGDLDFNLIGFKDGYRINITPINTSVGRTTEQNLTLTPFFGYRGPNSTVSGYVRDNATGLPIPNATLFVPGRTIVANGSGNFSFNISVGSHILTAIKTGYQNFIGNFTASINYNLTFIVNMTPFTEGVQDIDVTIKNNGTLIGYVTDNETNLSIEDVLVSVAGVTNLTNASGFYNITNYEGSTNLVATKSGYNVYFDEVNITAFNVTEYNFSMGRIIIDDIIPNGSIRGFVTNNEGFPLSDVFVAAAGTSNLSNTTGEYTLASVPPGTHNIVAVRDGFLNFVGEVNVTSGNVTEFNITMEVIVQAGLGEGEGAGQGPGDGAGLGSGQGPGTGIPAQIEQPTLILDYDLSIKKIIEKLRHGNFLTVPVEITNYRDETVSMSFSVEGDIAPLLRFDKSTLTLDAEATGEVTLTVVANVEPGVYDGFFVINGDVEDKIPIYILVYEHDLLDVEGLVLKVEAEDPTVFSGTTLDYKVDLKNLLIDESYKVDLTYSLKGINNNVSLEIEKENVFLLTAYSLVKTFDLPEDLPLGEYSLDVLANYLGTSSSGQAIIEIKLPFYKLGVFGIPVWVYLLILGTIGGIAYTLFFLKKRAEAKKRYHIELDYNQLPKAGPRAAFVGLIAETTKKAYFDLDQMQTHTLVAGSTGSGKSVAAQGIVEEALLKGTSVMVFDPTVQWTGFLSRCQDKKFLGLYPQFGLKKSDARAFSGNIHQVLDAREIIEFKKYMKPSEINVFVVNRLETKDYEIFVSNTIREVFKENMPESRQLRLVLVFDEFHRLLPKYGGTGQVLIQVERAAREFRKWGVGLVLISQVISDFQPEVLANINTQLQMRTKDEGDLTRTKNEYGDRYLQSLVKASIGAGMVENSAYNKGKPYFVQFRPLLHNTGRVSDEDLENYNKYNKIIDDLDYQLEQLEKESIDVFDLRLELKLALDKVKAGSFNMVDIYLQGLTPRIQTQWDKIGKKPKKRVVKRVSEAELQKELEKAKKDKDKATKKPGEKGAEASEAEAPAEEAKEKESSDIEDAAAQEKESITEAEQGTLSAIAKAKAAQERAKEAQEQEKKPEKKEDEPKNKGPGNSQESDSVDTTLTQVDKALQDHDKKALVSLYHTLQQSYKTASAEMKQTILQKCKLIQASLK